MSDLQKNVEQIIKNHIDYLTNSRGQKKSMHMSHQIRTMLEELFDNDRNGVIFVNHFGHIEYMNTSFSRYFMLDKSEKTFTNILNINQLPLEIEVKNHRFHMTYPNGSTLALNMTHQLVNFGKNTLLQFKFEDNSPVLEAREKLSKVNELNAFYMEHVQSPMFILNEEGIIVDVASPYQELMGIELSQLKNQSIFEYLPFDYANEVIDRVSKVTGKLNCHFLYSVEKNKIVKVYDTTLYQYIGGQVLCHVKDVSDLNTMSSTIEYLNTYDSLTGFYNMAYYEQKLQELDNNGNMPLGIYVLTLQGLKNLNKRMGYHKADNLIIGLALDIKSAISQYEVPCRISGDTFIIFFPSCSKTSMDKFLEVIDTHITKYKASYSDYFLTYNQRHLFLSDKPEDLHALVKGLII